MIWQAIKEVLVSFFPKRCLYESMMSYDFKIGPPRQKLMQLYFSHLASWPLFIMIGLIYFDPTKYSWSLQQIVGFDNPVIFFLLNGQLKNMLIFFGILFFLEWILRKEYLLTLIIIYFVSQSSLHIHLATTALLGIYFSKYCYLWWFHIDLESYTKKIWRTMANLQLLSWVVIAVAGLWILNNLQINHYFSGALNENRLEFLTLLVFALHATAFLFLMIWGHFEARHIVEPSYLPIHYSTSTWILRFKMSTYFRKILKEKNETALSQHLISLAQFKEVKDQSPGLSLGPLITTLNKEISYLNEASSRLTID